MMRFWFAFLAVVAGVVATAGQPAVARVADASEIGASFVRSEAASARHAVTQASRASVLGGPSWPEPSIGWARDQDPGVLTVRPGVDRARE